MGYGTVAKIKEIEGRLMGEVAVASGFLMDRSAASNRVAAAVSNEIGFILKASNHHPSLDARAKGVLRKLMDENKIAAASEVKSMVDGSMKALLDARAAQAEYLSPFRSDLTAATKHLYKTLAHKKATAGAKGAFYT